MSNTANLPAVTADNLEEGSNFTVIEYYKATLESAKQERDILQNERGPLDGFHMGRVGFRNDTRRQEREQGRNWKRLERIAKLTEFIEAEERKIAAKNAPVKPSPYCTDISEIKAGETRTHCMYGICTILRVSKKTVTIKTPSGYTEAVKPTFIYRKK